MQVLDSVVSLVWIGGLALVLLGKAVTAWLRFRYATRSAVHASRLAEVTRPDARPRPIRKTGEVLALQPKPPAMPAARKREA